MDEEADHGVVELQGKGDQARIHKRCPDHDVDIEQPVHEDGVTDCGDEQDRGDSAEVDEAEIP